CAGAAERTRGRGRCRGDCAPRARGRRVLRRAAEVMLAARMRILLVTPPMTQVNTPYPATAYLTGCLRRHAPGDVTVEQADLSLELFLRLFSRAGLEAVREQLLAARGPSRRRPPRRK